MAANLTHDIFKRTFLNGNIIDSIFTGVCSYGSIWKDPSIGLDNGLAHVIAQFYTVRSRYLAAIFLQITHERHP